MTDAQTQLDRLAQRYAKALVDYHITKGSDDFNTLCYLQNMMNEVAKEVATEIKGE